MSNYDPGDPRPKLHSFQDIVAMIMNIVSDIRKIRRAITGVARTTIDGGSPVFSYTTVNVIQQFSVTFNKPFENTPAVFVQPTTGNAGKVFATPSGISTTGFTVNLYRTDASNANTTVCWTAIDTAY